MMQKFNPLDYPISFVEPLRIAPSTWAAHIPFAMFLMDIFRPSVVVELGTQYGVSYCAFCQAVASLKMNTRCYAVDTWQGDAHAGQYGIDVLMDLKGHHDPLYSNFSRLMQSTFDNALGQFDDGTIDLLHIDGYHTYEAVRNDFYNWLPKLSNRGVVLFHDIAVREHDFGVWKFWDEHKIKYPHFEFSQGYGLGGLVVGKDSPPGLNILLSESDVLPYIKEFFTQMGTKVEKEFLLAGQLAEKERELKGILDSNAWGVAKLLWKIRDWFLRVAGFRKSFKTPQ